MSKVIVDQGLAGTIKALRIQNNIAAKDLAIELGKSRSYVSKLESGDIASIDSQDLEKCLRFISQENKTDEIIDTVFKTVSVRFTREEIEKMIWLFNFDTVYRRIPIPEGFSQAYIEKLSQDGISIARLVEEINKNLFIPKAVLHKRGIPENLWFPFGNDTYIKMSISEDKIKSILFGEKTKCNYVTLKSIVLYHLKLTEYKDVDLSNSDIVQEMLTKTRDILEQYHVYTLTRKSELLEKAVDSQELFSRMSFHEKVNAEVINQFNPLLLLFSYYDIEAANRLISEFTKNMEWDAPFIMEVAGLPFYKLDHCSFRIKKELLEKIRKFLNDTFELPETEKKREEY